MEEKELRTSIGQRVAITLIAVAMLGSIIAGYVAIIVNNGKSSLDDTAGIGNEKIATYEASYKEKLEDFQELTAGDFAIFSQYKSEVKTFDEEAANNNGVQIKEILAGSGRELTAGDTDYLAYYVGYCADGSIFESSLDDNDEPTVFTSALDPSQGLIEGWNTGVVGMKLGGIRRLTIPGELAYGESKKICGGYNKPLRFIVMAVANEEPLKTVASELSLAYMKYMYAIVYGIDYDEMIGN